MGLRADLYVNRDVGQTEPQLKQRNLEKRNISRQQRRFFVSEPTLSHVQHGGGVPENVQGEAHQTDAEDLVLPRCRPENQPQQNSGAGGR